MILLIGIGILLVVLLSVALDWYVVYRGRISEGNGGGIRSRFY